MCKGNKTTNGHQRVEEDEKMWEAKADDVCGKEMDCVCKREKEKAYKNKRGIFECMGSCICLS